ncbi:hypothetical protein OPFAMLBM_00254 [Aeromonas phage avDM12-TAAL]|nr:hypothetical protein OPFAMLBM_00254 [Aeromonas phage avDM12-TAAL]
MTYIQEVIATRPADHEFKYMLLSRMKSDCEFFLGYGNRSESRLWAGSVDEQIESMKALYNSFETKPEWITMQMIEEYETDMKGE